MELSPTRFVSVWRYDLDAAGVAITGESLKLNVTKAVFSSIMKFICEPKYKAVIEV